MNLGFYGHTKTIVYMSTSKDGKFTKSAMPYGIRQVHFAAKQSIDSDWTTIESEWDTNPDDNEYRRDYYEKQTVKAPGKNKFYETGRYLGYEDGTTKDNIFSEKLNGENCDVLFVWDEGYGGLKVPDSEYVFWGSNKVLPDKDEFDKIADKCFLFLDGDLLRKTGAMISKQLSWERTATELVMEIQQNPSINYLLQAKHLFISFGLDGAVYILRDGEKPNLDAALCLTHGGIEGAILDEYPNIYSEAIIFQMMSQIIMGTVAGMILHMQKNNEPSDERTDDFFETALDGLLAIYVKAKQRSALSFGNADNKAVRWGGILRFVLESGETIISYTVFENEEKAAAELSEEAKQLDMRDWPAFSIPLTQREGLYEVPPDWTITNSVGKLSDVAFNYVQNGAVAIDGLPQLSLGAFTTVDRWEIEAYQNIRNLILDYAGGESSRPLSIAVFGSPGSGKSFGVTEIAKNVLPGKIEKLEFNVSQFTSLSDLGVAFQKVRDTILGGKLPLVFFDEFDSDRDGVQLGWLKTFLMPMQDGKFKDDSGEHPLGRCILVFAGGTAATFEEFSVNEQNFKNIKGPDFVSRLRGTINVLGPNAKDENDKNHILRRALLLHSLVKRHGIAAVSPKIVHAMLHVPEYKHGARSMEAILDMSRIDGSSWEPVSLPSHSQLALHVDADEFIKLVLGSEGK